MKTTMKEQFNIKVMLSFAMALAVVVMTACGGGAKQAETDKSETKTKDETFKSVTKYPIPTAFEVIKLLNKAGATYILSINNPVENVDKYFTEKSKALNLGVYGADLSYASTYQMKQETMNYLKVSKKLIDDLQITTAFTKDFAEKVESNIDNKDALIQIISDSFYDTYDYLNNQGKDNLSLLVMAGSWVEGLYLTCQIATISKNNEDFLAIIVNQKEPLEKLYELLESASDDSAISEVVEMLNPLKTIFDGIEDFEISEDTFVSIENEVSRVRTSITQ